MSSLKADKSTVYLVLPFKDGKKMGCKSDLGNSPSPGSSAGEENRFVL